MKRKLIRITTVPSSLDLLLKGQLSFLNQFYEVIAVSDYGTALEVVKEREGVKVIAVEMKREISFIKDLRALFRLTLLLLKEHPFIVHANTPKGSLLSMLAAKITGVPHRIYNVTGLRYETERGLKRRVLIAMEKLTCWAASRVIPEGNGVKTSLIKTQITKKPLKVVGNGSVNGVDLNYFSITHVSEANLSLLRNAYHFKDEFVFCFIGRIVKSKGITELVLSFIRIYNSGRHIKLLILGTSEGESDPVESSILSLIKYHPGICAVGYQKDIRPHLALSNVLVLPSYREGFPNVVLQAGAMSVPAIVSDISGCNEIIIHGKNGLIIPPRNTEALETAMLFMLDQTKIYSAMTSCCREMISNRFSQQFIWTELLKEYEHLPN